MDGCGRKKREGGEKVWGSLVEKKGNMTRLDIHQFSAVCVYVK